MIPIGKPVEDEVRGPRRESNGCGVSFVAGCVPIVVLPEANDGRIPYPRRLPCRLFHHAQEHVRVSFPDGILDSSDDGVGVRGNRAVSRSGHARKYAVPGTNLDPNALFSGACMQPAVIATTSGITSTCRCDQLPWPTYPVEVITREGQASRPRTQKPTARKPIPNRTASAVSVLASPAAAYGSGVT